MKRQGTIVAVLVVAVIALVIWRCRGSGDDDSPGDGSAAGNTGGKAIDVRAARPKIDPKTVSRASISGTVTEDGKQPIAKARVCADGSSRDIPHELLRDSICAD